MVNRKTKIQKPDDYIQVGPMEIVRFGNEIIMKNSMTKKEHHDYISELAKQYPEIKSEIDKLVSEIRDIIMNYNPLELLHQSYGNMFISMVGKTSEFQYDFDGMVAVRMIDYIQSIIVSNKSKAVAKSSVDTEKWFDLYEKVSQLYSNLSQYHICHTAHLMSTDTNFNGDYNSLYVQAQELRTNVRGQRYPVHEKQHHLDLLSAHEEVFQELFSISIEELLDGMEKIQNSLMRGLGDAMHDFSNLMEKTLPIMEEHKKNTEEEPSDEMEYLLDEMGLSEIRDSIVGRFMGYDLFDVEKVSGLPKTLLKELSWKIGEEKDFFTEGEYVGWPLRRLPIEQRPFICVEDRIYCFDLYSLFDNLYRVLQRLILRLKPEYKAEWNEKQKEVSEQVPFTLFEKILHGGESYKSIYYQSKTGNKGKRQWCECDGIIIYDDHLIVIEVKAGSFTYTHPSTDFPAFIKSLDSLAKKPHEQASRLIDTIQTESKLIVCDEEHKPMRELVLEEFRHITACSVTVDNFNEFTARIDKLSSIGVELSGYPSWNISIDELRIYAEYFNSPSIFLHFLEQRLKAAISKDLELYDELDHLGLYIEHNHYTKTAEDKKEKHILWHGYREKIDNYFSSLVFQELERPEKPVQELPLRLKEMIDVLDRQGKRHFTKVASSILDLNGDNRKGIESKINMLIIKQFETQRVMPLSIFGESKITFICNHDSVKQYSTEQSKEYILATLLKTDDDTRLGIYLNYNNKGQLYNVDFEFLSKDDIPYDRIDEYHMLSEQYAKSRISSYVMQNGLKKVGRNDICPCGSGKKYKRCCGMYL